MIEGGLSCTMEKQFLVCQDSRVNETPLIDETDNSVQLNFLPVDNSKMSVGLEVPFDAQILSRVSQHYLGTPGAPQSYLEDHFQASLVQKESNLG